LDGGVRRAVLAAVARHPSDTALKMLEDFAANWGPLNEEARVELERRKARSAK
jgi:hypothetical protein